MTTKDKNKKDINFVIKAFSDFEKLPKTILFCGILLASLLIAGGMYSIASAGPDIYSHYNLISNSRETILTSVEILSITTMASLALQYFSKSSE